MGLVITHVCIIAEKKYLKSISFLVPSVRVSKHYLSREGREKPDTVDFRLFEALPAATVAQAVHH